MKVWFLFIIICLSVITGWGQSTNSIDTSFESHKGRLPFPVDRYTKLNTYTKNLQRINTLLIACYPIHNLTILSDSIINVRNSFKGIVQSIFEVDGKMYIFVHHGNYFFTYGNLDTSFVKKGDTVLSRQLIGRVSNFNNDQLYELEVFLTNKEGHQLDPYPWFADSKRPFKK
jgi:hypothetical protein